MNQHEAWERIYGALWEAYEHGGQFDPWYSFADHAQDLLKILYETDD